MVKSVKISLFITIAANLAVLITGYGFYPSTLPNHNSRLDICSGIPGREIDLLMAAAALLLGLTSAIWGISQSLTRRAYSSSIAAAFAMLLSFPPLGLGQVINAYVIRVHAANIYSDCQR